MTKKPKTGTAPMAPDARDAHPSVTDIPPESPSRKNKVANWVAGAALLVIAITIGIFAYWSSQPSDPLVIKNAPFPVRTIRKEPTADGVIILTVDYCKTSNASGSVRTSFVSQSREIFLPIAKEHIPKGCQKQEIPVIIPKDIVPDTYKIKFHVTYNVNPLKKAEIVDFESQPITIASNGDPNATIVVPQP